MPRALRALASALALCLALGYLAPGASGLYLYQVPPQQLAGQPEHQAPVAPVEPANQPDAGDGHPFGQQQAGPIFRFQGSALNSTTVRLKWNLRNGHHSDFFDILYGPMPDATHSFAVSKLNGTARDHTFHNLQPDTEYQFEIRQHEEPVGAAPAAKFKPHFVAVRTPATNSAPSRPPQEHANRDIMPLGVKAEGKSNNSVQLSWTEPERPANFQKSRRVHIIRYYLNPSAANQSAESAGAANASAPQYHYLNVTDIKESKLVIQRLRPATEYAFAVKTAYYTPDMKKLYTQSGFSMDTLARTFDLEPSAPRNFTVSPLAPTREDPTSLRLELSWAPPDSPNGQLRGYVIMYSHDPNAPDAQWQQIEANGSTTNSWYVHKLQPGYNYYFKVRAVNQKGQGPDSDTRLYIAPMSAPADKFNMPIPPNNLLLLIAICMLILLFALGIIVSRLACSSRRKPRKGSMNAAAANQKSLANGNLSSAHFGNAPKLNGFATTNSSSTVAARVGTLARRRDNTTSGGKPDFWISAMNQQADAKSNVSEKSNSDLNMAMVSIQRDSPQFATTTQLAPALPEYRFASGVDQQQQLIQQFQQQSHYHPGHFTGQLGFDQMDNATASALMTLSKRQQQQLQKYQIQFASTNGVPSSLASNFGALGTLSGSGHSNQVPGNMVGAQAPSPHQQPPPPPPLNIEQQQQQQPLYGTHQTLASTRSLRMHRPTLYDPVSGSFVQGSGLNTSTTDSNGGGPPNYNSHHHNAGMMISGANGTSAPFGNHTLQFNHHHNHAHQTSTLLGRRATNTLRSFQNSGAGGNQLYGQLGGPNSTFGPIQPIGNNQQAGILQGHQAVINQLNSSSNFPSLPLKHVSTVRPQIMSSLEDQIEMELAEKQAEQQSGQQQQTTPQQQQSPDQATIKQ